MVLRQNNAICIYFLFDEIDKIDPIIYIYIIKYLAEHGIDINNLFPWKHIYFKKKEMKP